MSISESFSSRSNADISSGMQGKTFDKSTITTFSLKVDSYIAATIVNLSWWKPVWCVRFARTRFAIFTHSTKFHHNRMNDRIKHAHRNLNFSWRTKKTEKVTKLKSYSPGCGFIGLTRPIRLGRQSVLLICLKNEWDSNWLADGLFSGSLKFVQGRYMRPACCFAHRIYPFPWEISRFRSYLDINILISYWDEKHSKYIF